MPIQNGNIYVCTVHLVSKQSHSKYSNPSHTPPPRPPLVLFPNFRRYRYAHINANMANTYISAKKGGVYCLQM